MSPYIRFDTVQLGHLRVMNVTIHLATAGLGSCIDRHSSAPVAGQCGQIAVIPRIWRVRAGGILNSPL